MNYVWVLDGSNPRPQLLFRPASIRLINHRIIFLWDEEYLVRTESHRANEAYTKISSASSLPGL